MSIADREHDPRPDLAYSRTHLANQRTYAAWLRTALSIAVAGFAVVHIAPGYVRDAPAAVAFGTALVLLAIAVILFGAWSFRRIARTLAGAGTPIPRPPAGWCTRAPALSPCCWPPASSFSEAWSAMKISDAGVQP